MAVVVLDVSATLAWLLSSEPDERAHALFKKIADGGAIVTQGWRIDIADALLKAERRKRIDRDLRIASLADLRILPITVDEETGDHAWSGSVALAERHGIPVSDTATLELAQRLGLPLATWNDDLRVAAKAAGVTTV